MATDSGLSGLQKAAVLLIALGPEKSSHIFKHLKEDEIEELTLEIANTRSITPQLKETVIEEFYQVCLAQQYIAEGGIGYAKELLEKALGEERARDVIGKLTASLQVKPFEFVRKTDASQLLNFIQDEHPQTIALILSYLSPTQAAGIISTLTPDKQTDVAKRIALMDRTSPDVIKEVENILEQKLASLVNQDYTIVGGRMDNDSIAKQMTTGSSADVSMEIPLTTLEDLYGYYTDEFSSFFVFADSSEYVTEISKQVKSLLEARYNVRGKEYIQAYDMASQVGMISDILNYVTIFIMLVAGIALIVGGIGVMNIMLVSVTERTKEIGIRKALGAKTGSILFQFLMEAVIITLIGGFVGIVLGILGAKGICGLASSMGMGSMEAVIDPKVIIAATGFSSLIGIFFGIYPAKKAAKLSPIEALRHE